MDASDLDGGGLRIRVYDEEHTPPESAVRTIYVFYRIGLPSLARALEVAWAREGIVPSGAFPGGSLRIYEFNGRRNHILRCVESVHRNHLPA